MKQRPLELQSNLKYALVTGSSSGIGQVLIQNLLQDGHIVFGASLAESLIEHENYTDIICDLSDESAVEELAAIISERTQDLHLVIHLAGLFQMSPLLETSGKELKLLFETNVLGSFHLLKHLIGFMVEEETHLILASNQAAKAALPNLAGYTSSMMGQLGLFDTLKEEWAHLNLRYSNLLIDPFESTLWDNTDLEISNEFMLTIDDVAQVFMMVINSPKTIDFPRLVVRNSKQNLLRPEQVL